MRAQFPSQQWLRVRLTDHRGRLRLAVAVVAGAVATAVLAQGAGSLGCNLTDEASQIAHIGQNVGIFHWRHTLGRVDRLVR
jgi:hypothetical protein